MLAWLTFSFVLSCFALGVFAGTCYDLMRLPSEEPTGTYQTWLLGFSAYSNVKKLLDCSPPKKGQIGCINGIRFWSMVWVVISHVYGSVQSRANSLNKNYVDNEVLNVNRTLFNEFLSFNLALGSESFSMDFPALTPFTLSEGYCLAT